MRLLVPVSAGDELAPGLRFEGASVELGMRYAFAGPAGRIHVEIASNEDAPRAAVRTTHFAISYRTDPTRPVDAALGMELCERVSERVRDNEDAVLEAMRRDAATGSADAARVRRVDVDQLLERAGSEREPHYTLSTYVGCVIGCRFCYAQAPLSAARRLSGLPDVPWGSYVDVRMNAPEVLAEELSRLPRLPIKFCPIVSDPYQATEAKERVTRKCLAAIAAARWVPLVLTRSALVLEDRALLASIPDAHVGVSLPTVDETVRRHFEPRAASVDERLEVLRTLRARGVATFAVVQPILPGDIRALADALAETVASVSIDVLRGEYSATPDFESSTEVHAREEGWQRDRAEELRGELEGRGVAVWPGELPPALAPSARS